MARKKANYPLVEGLEITTLAAEGKAMGRWNDVVVFVPLTVPGDVVDVQIRSKRRRFMEGFVVRYVKKSPLRAEAFCEHFGVCGGCKWQNLPYGEQLRFKGTWMRISRRAVRDYNFRGTDLLETLLMWYNVRRGEKKYISPYKGRAHVIIDSSLRYEVPVFAHYADALRAAVEQVPPDNERWQEYHDLVDAFRYFEPVDPALVAPDSLLREFIGGGRYHY